MKYQKELIQELRNTNNQSWILILDACRADMLDKIIDNKSFDIVYNGGVNCTTDWFNTMFRYKTNGHLFHGGNSISSIEAGADYNENEYFTKVPSAEIYNSNTYYNLSVSGPAEVNQIVKLHIVNTEPVEERLEALGYGKSNLQLDHFNLNVVRYLQPHTPYRMITYSEIQEYGPNYERALINMIESGELDYTDLKEFYLDNLEWAYNGAMELVEFLDGDIIITSDHGECFGACGAWFHGEKYHDHMTEVPWMVIQ